MKSPTAIERLNAALSGRYRIERELGEGGMATVYLADDVKHERKVALKVLKPELSAVVGADRFLAEIKTTAKLQHPHILPLHDSGEADGLLFYVMPYVEGETLRERIDREHQLPVDDAVRMATNMAEALDYAHRQGVIHRDIKPANVLLLDDKPVISDFGIALAVGAAGGGRLTETGLSVGTPRYMSPEQATGDQDVGPKSDIYSLGCVLYEMLVGDPPFTGSTAQAILGKIISGTTTQVAAHRPSVPANVDGATMTAIERIPADRFAHASDFVAALRDPSFRAASGLASSDELRAPRRGTLVPVLAGALLSSAAFLLWGWMTPDATPSVLRYDLPIQEGREWTAAEVWYTSDISPDGMWIVRAWQRDADSVVHLETKRRDQLDFEPIAGTDDAIAPMVSPDGTRIAFISDDLNVIPAAGGPVATIADSVKIYDWLTNDDFVFIDWDSERMFRVPALGGEPELLFETDDTAGLGWWLSALPGERGVIFQRCTLACEERNTWVLDLESGEARFLHEAMSAQFLARTGHVLLGTRDGTLLAAPLDLEALELSATPVPVLQGLATDPDDVGFTVSESGTLIVGLGPQVGLDDGNDFEAVWVTRSGEVEAIDRDWRFSQGTLLGGLALSPDGGRLAIALASQDDGESDDIWVKELPDGPVSRLTRDPARDGRPYFTPDGEEIVFVRMFDDESQETGLFRIRADGANSATPVLTSVVNPAELDFSRDGNWIVLRTGGRSDAENLRDLTAYRLGTDTTEVPILVGSYDEAHPKLSPDGRWLAYNSTESGQNEVYVRPFPDVESARVQVSIDGGLGPMWNPVSNELHYSACCPPSMESATYVTNPRFEITSRETLTIGWDPRLLYPSSRASSYAISPDGDRLLFLRQAQDGDGESDSEPRIIVVENWVQELLARIGGGR